MRFFWLSLLVASCGGRAAPPSSTPLVETRSLSVSGRAVNLFLPAFAYDKSQASFLVLNDGQDVLALGLATTLDDLWSRGKLAPMVVIAIPASDRLQDYGTAEHDVSIPCDTGSQVLGKSAASYGRFVLDLALAAAAQAAGFRPPAARTVFLGASLGGLSAFSIAWDHPEVFGFAGAMSGSFWWRTSSASLQNEQNTRIMQNIVARSAKRPGWRAWLEAGTDDETADRDGNGIIDAIDDTLWLMEMMKGLGMAEGTDYVYLQVEHGIHGYPTWSAVLPQFLTWAAGR